MLLLRKIFDRRSRRNIRMIKKILEGMGVEVDENRLWEKTADELEKIKVLLIVARKEGKAIRYSDILDIKKLEKRVHG